MIYFQRPAFPALNNFCNKHLYTKLLSQFTAVHLNFILVGLVSHSSLAIFRSHADIYSLYQLKVYFLFVFLDCVCRREGFIKSMFVILRFCSIHFIVILAKLKKIVHYTQDFVI